MIFVSPWANNKQLRKKPLGNFLFTYILEKLTRYSKFLRGQNFSADITGIQRETTPIIQNNIQKNFKYFVFDLEMNCSNYMVK